MKPFMGAELKLWRCSLFLDLQILRFVPLIIYLGLRVRLHADHAYLFSVFILEAVTFNQKMHFLCFFCMWNISHSQLNLNEYKLQKKRNEEICRHKPNLLSYNSVSLCLFFHAHNIIRLSLILRDQLENKTALYFLLLINSKKNYAKTSVIPKGIKDQITANYTMGIYEAFNWYLFEFVASNCLQLNHM